MYLIKTEVAFERISFYKVIGGAWQTKTLSVMFHKFSMTLYCLPCFYNSDIIDLLPQQLRNYQMFLAYTEPIRSCQSVGHSAVRICTKNRVGSVI